MSAQDTPPTTDFGAPILAGPFDSMGEAQEWIDESPDQSADIYWEDSRWYAHGSADGGGEAPPLTTYGT